MARTFEMSRGRHVANWMMKRLLGLGVPVGNNFLLTIPGRKTGTPHSTPVTLLERDNQRYLVAPYGEVEWVENARAARQVTLSRGREYEIIGVTELKPDEAAPVLKQYVCEVPIVRPYFDSAPDSTLAHFEAEAPRKPVFRLGGKS
jgi:deazaflavin-dependent oxidoreductase (nitroreductase family)